ncbi:MAG: SRPBCC family protein [Syntrophothermus sp.]
MDKIHFSVLINAPKDKVWNTMLNKGTYEQWTKAFNPTSRYEGEFSKGNKIKFIGIDENGKEGGMLSRVAEYSPYDFISFEHYGVIHDGKEDTESDEVKSWQGSHENYTFREIDGKTELSIDADSTPELKEMFESMWPGALQKLKEISEK